jgi:uncharacterized protein YwqG
MLSRENERLLRRLIAKHALTPVEDAIVEEAAECSLLVRGSREDYAAVGNSRYGGVPDLPPSIPWPRNCESYLNFLMQVNLRDVPTITGSPLPKSGMLYFFLDCDEDGSDVAAQVRFFKGSQTSLRKATAPPNEMLCEPYYRNLMPHKIKNDCRIDVPNVGSHLFNQVRQSAEMNVTGDAGDRLFQLSNEARRKTSALENIRNSRDVGQLLGCVPWSDEGADLREYAVLKSIGKSAYISDSTYMKRDQKKLRAGAVDWRLLWRIRSNLRVGISIHDAGEFNILITIADLKNRDFSKVYVEVESA